MNDYHEPITFTTELPGEAFLVMQERELDMAWRRRDWPTYHAVRRNVRHYSRLIRGYQPPIFTARTK